MWQELRAYVEGLRRETDETGAPKVAFPSDYDEVVDLMGRGDLGDSSWAAVALRAGVSQVCAQDARCKGALEEELDREKVAAGLARIEQLDRKLRARQARARRIADELSELASPTKSETTLASSDRAFLTDRKRLARRRGPDEVRENREDRELRSEFLVDDDDAFRELEDGYGPSSVDADRLAAIDNELLRLGVDEARLVPPPTPELPDDILHRFRADRQARAHELDVDRRLALARTAPLVVLDDGEVAEFEAHNSPLLPPPCASDIAALVAALEAEKPLPTDEQQRAQVKDTVDRLANSMRATIDVVAFVRDQRRRNKQQDDDDGEVTTRHPLVVEAPRRHAFEDRAFDAPTELTRLSDSLLEISLKTTSAVEHADATLKRAKLSLERSPAD